jgi:hypothetical protein
MPVGCSTLRRVKVMECCKTSALISGRCAIASNEGAAKVRTGATRWSTATWWQCEQATVAKSCPLRAVCAEFTIWPQAGPAIVRVESAASAVKALTLAPSFARNGRVIVSPRGSILRKINARGLPRFSYLKHDNCRFSVPFCERFDVCHARPPLKSRRS